MYCSGIYFCYIHDHLIFSFYTFSTIYHASKKCQAFILKCIMFPKVIYVFFFFNYLFNLDIFVIIIQAKKLMIVKQHLNTLHVHVQMQLCLSLFKTLFTVVEIRVWNFFFCRLATTKIIKIYRTEGHGLSHANFHECFQEIFKLSKIA